MTSSTLPATQATKQSLIPGNKKTFSVFMNSDGIKNKVNEILQDPRKGERFITTIISLVAQNPTLATCENSTIMSAGLNGYSLGLSPQLGQFYVVPYGNKATFQLGYKGLVQLAQRTGQYRFLNVATVRKGDVFKFNELTEVVEAFERNSTEDAAPTHYIATFELLNGYKKTVVWSFEKMKAHALKFSKSGLKGNFWGGNFEQMAHKTVLRALLTKWGPLSVDMERALVTDNNEVTESGNPVAYVNNEDEEMSAQQTVIAEPVEIEAEPAPEEDNPFA